MPLDNREIIHYNTSVNGVWRSLVSRLVRVQEAWGSNPHTPTKIDKFRINLSIFLLSKSYLTFAGSVFSDLGDF